MQFNCGIFNNEDKMIAFLNKTTVGVAADVF